MVADYWFDVNNIDIWAPPFFKHNNLFKATVICCSNLFCPVPNYNRLVHLKEVKIVALQFLKIFLLSGWLSAEICKKWIENSFPSSGLWVSSFWKKKSEKKTISSNLSLYEFNLLVRYKKFTFSFFFLHKSKLVWNKQRSIEDLNYRGRSLSSSHSKIHTIVWKEWSRRSVYLRKNQL